MPIRIVADIRKRKESAAREDGLSIRYTNDKETWISSMPLRNETKRLAIACALSRFWQAQVFLRIGTVDFSIAGYSPACSANLPPASPTHRTYRC